MKKVLDWVKENVLVVVLGAVAIVALGLGWFFSGSLNESVRETAKEKASRMTELAALEKSSLTLNIPGRESVSKTVVMNEALLKEYEKVAELLKEDAGRIREMAVARNKGDHKVVLEGVFPAHPESMRERIPFDLQEALDKAYKKLLTDVNAGTPPPVDQVAESLAQRESQYILSTLRKANREALDEREKSDLKEELGRSRLAIYGEQAQKISVYIMPGAIQIPPPPGKNRTSTAEMFDWQWRYWVVRDILMAVADASEAANGGSLGSELKSPVKRILSISVDPAEFLSGGSGGGGQQGGTGLGASNFGASNVVDGGTPPAEGAAAAANPNAPLGPPQIDVSTEAPRDFARSLTGRVKSSAFDVRRATVSAIVATSQLPTFFDALAKRNFITVTNVRIDPALPFEDAAAGFIYGRDPVSRVTLDLESVWLREWTAPLMPVDVRTALGIQNQAPAEAAPANPAAG